MAGKQIKKKKLQQWFDAFYLHPELGQDSLDIDYFTYSNITHEQWEGVMWRIFQLCKIYIKNYKSDIKICLYMEIIVDRYRSKAYGEISKFHLNAKRPPNVLLYRKHLTDILPEGSIYSSGIGNLYKMNAWIHHNNEDPEPVCYLFLSETM